jgi:four helix bundle protein
MRDERGGNIAEGFERGSRSEFYQFLVVAKASCAELRSQLYIAQDVGYIEKEVLSNISSRADELARILGGLRAAVQKQRDKE